MGQTLNFKAISQQHYTKGLELAQTAVKELYAVQELDTVDFNFKIKNLFVMPGNVTRGIFIGDNMIGFIICSHNELLWSNDKKLSVEFFYMEQSHNTEDNINEVYAYIENYAFTNGYGSITFTDSLPYFADYVKGLDETKTIATMYEKEVV